MDGNGKERVFAHSDEDKFKSEGNVICKGLPLQSHENPE